MQLNAARLGIFLMVATPAGRTRGSREGTTPRTPTWDRRLDLKDRRANANISPLERGGGCFFEAGQIEWAPMSPEAGKSSAPSGCTVETKKGVSMSFEGRRLKVLLATHHPASSAP